MLHAVAGVNLGAAIFAMNGQRDDHRALGIFQARPFAFRHLQMIRGGVKLLARHLKRGMIVNIHKIDLVKFFPA